MELKDYITIRKLNKIYDTMALENGIGCLFIKDEDVLSAFYHNGAPMRYLAYIEFSPGKPRGNHYHKKREENICLIKGTLYAKYWLPEKPSEIYEQNLFAGDSVNIKPGCSHVYISNEPAIAVEFSPQNYESADFYK